MADMLGSAASLLVLGFLLGVRHATDADHVVAVATIVSRQRTLRGSALIGAAWGIGHTLTILAVGSAIILFGIAIPPRLGLAMELAVGLMLIALGVLTLTGIGRVIAGAVVPHGGGHAHPHGPAGDPHTHTHAHGDYIHRHMHGHGGAGHGHREEETPVARLDRALGRFAPYAWLRPLLVGVVHGLAGSAAVALLVLTLVGEPGWGIAYLLLFGAGTVLGMMLITLVLAAPFAFTSARLPRLNWQLRVASGLVSFAFGLFLVYEIGFMEGGLFTPDPHWDPH